MYRLHSDCCKEATDALGLWHTTTIPYTPSMNGRAERMVQSLKLATASTLLHSGIGPQWWEEAMSQACFLKRHSAATGCCLVRCQRTSFTQETL